MCVGVCIASPLNQCICNSSPVTSFTNRHYYGVFLVISKTLPNVLMSPPALKSCGRNHEIISKHFAFMLRLTFACAFLRGGGDTPTPHVSNVPTPSWVLRRVFTGWNSHTTLQIYSGNEHSLEFICFIGCLPPIEWVKPSLFETWISGRNNGQGFVLPSRPGKRTLRDSHSS